MARGVNVLDAGTRALISDAIVNPARLQPLRYFMVCAQCHSLRELDASGFHAGANYYDYFAPILEYQQPKSANPAYWPDGRPRHASNEAFGLWQSQCFLKGKATCGTCHIRAHQSDVAADPKLRANDNSLCSGCHKAIADNPALHTHHAADNAGSQCVACHMAKVVSAAETMHDHSISVPAPGNTPRYGIPNACNDCHRDKGAEWASRQMVTWYGNQAEKAMEDRAETFTAARDGDPQSVPALLRIATDASGGPLIRANAIGYLGTFPDEPAAYQAELDALSDAEPLIRATAAAAIEPRAAQRVTVALALASLLHDPTALVRLNAVVALVNMGATQVAPQDSEWFDRALVLYRDRLQLHAENPQQQFAAGKFFLGLGELDSAVSALRTAMKLDPAIPGQYYLALALARGGQLAEAQQILQQIPPNHPDYVPARPLLALVEQQIAAKNGDRHPGEKQFFEAQVQFQGHSYSRALTLLNQALAAAPQAPWATKAKIYRAVSLAKLGQTQEAEPAMRALVGTPAGRRDVDLQLAYIELLYDTAQIDTALRRTDAFLAAAPDVPQAYLWQARLLLQLGRIDEAARAADESLRLQPALPGVHSLLMKIYQKQGRMQEAAKQAQWLRNYQRRNE